MTVSVNQISNMQYIRRDHALSWLCNYQFTHILHGTRIGNGTPIRQPKPTRVNILLKSTRAVNITTANIAHGHMHSLRLYYLSDIPSLFN